MKRISILLIAFLLLGSFAYANTFDVDFSGEATGAFGVDLEDGQTGFYNDAEATLELTFVPEQTLESEGSGWYGHIAIDFAFVLELSDADESDDITDVDSDDLLTANVDHARITNDLVYIQIWGVPDDSSEAAGSIFNDDFDEFLGDDGFSVIQDSMLMQTFNNVANAGSEFVIDGEFEPGFRWNDNDIQGITIGYGDGELINDLSVGIVSDGNWNENEDNRYAFRLNADVQPIDLIGFATTLYIGFDDDDLGTAIGSSSELTVSLDDAVEGLSLAAGFDFRTVTDAPDGAGLDWAASLAVTQVLAEDTHVRAMVAMSPENNPGAVTDEDELEFDVGLLFREDTEAGLAPGIGLGLGVSLQNLGGDEDGNNETLGFLLDAEYDEGGVNPFVGFGYHTPIWEDAPELAYVAYEVGLNLKEELHGINNTEFSLRYGTWDAYADGPEGLEVGDDAGAGGFADLRAGYLTLSTTISF